MLYWRVFRGLVLLVLLLIFGACTPVLLPNVEQPIAEQPAALLMVPVCGKPTELNTTQNTWAYSETMRLVPSTDEAAFRIAALQQGRFYATNVMHQRVQPQ